MLPLEQPLSLGERSAKPLRMEGRTVKARRLGSVAIAGAAFVLLAAQRLIAAGPAGDPEPRPVCQRLPDPMPDLVAMVRAERPVAVAGEYAGRDKARSEELRAIQRRRSEGDRGEAMRLYGIFAEKCRGTPEAAEALFAVACWRIPRYEARSSTPTDLAPIGEIAVRLAEENPDHHLTVRTLDMYLSESLKAMGLAYLRLYQGLYWSGKTELASAPYVPSSEEWRRTFRCAAILAGRYPDDVRGPKCLLGVAEALASSPRAEAAATDLYRLVSEWPDAWDLRFRAYKALHDQAIDRGEVAWAREMALKAATTCAGRTSSLRRGRPTDGAPESKLDTPWQQMLDEGIPSEGKVLLRKPDWAEGTRLVFRVSEHKRRRSPNEWRAVRSAAPGEQKGPVAYLLRRGPGDAFVAVASADSVPRERAVPSDHRGRRPYLAFLGRPDTVCVHDTSLLFLPKFPVREGVDIFPCDGVALARQEAQADGDRVVVKILAGHKTVWRQTWSADEPWWDEAEVTYEVFDYDGPWGPGPYDVDPGWGMGTYLRRITRTTETDGLALPSALELERLACEKIHPLSVRPQLRPAILSQLPKLFTGEELERLQAWWQGKPDPIVSKKADVEREELRVVESLLAAGDGSGALAKLDARKVWPARHDLALLLRARALLALSKPREAAEILRWTPRRGPVACAEARLLELRAWEACGEHLLALAAAHGLFRDHAGSTEAKAAGTAVGRLRRHAGDLREARRRDPYFGFCLRSLWYPKTGHLKPSGIRVDRTDGVAALAVWDFNWWRWRISPDGDELDPPEIVNTPRPDRGRWRNDPGRAEICREGGVVFAKEGDRLIAEDAHGKELWRYTVVSRPPGDMRRLQMGLPRLTDPTALRRPGGRRIVCGVGHRTVSIGMGVYYSPVSGGLLAIDLAGKLVYQKEVGYCEALTIVSRGERNPMAIGMFLERDTSAKRWEFRGEWFVAAFDALTGRELWRSALSCEEKQYRQWRHTKPLLLLSGNADSRRIVVSLGGITLLDLEGHKIGAKEGVEVQQIADLDRDGTEEIIGCRRRYSYDSAGRLYILDLDGDTRWESPPGRWSVCCIEDLDGDGWKELLTIRKSDPDAVAIFGRPRNAP